MTTNIKALINKYYETRGLPLPDNTTPLEKRPHDYGMCVPDCQICQGLGLVETDSGLRACPNNPRRFFETGVSEADTNLWQRIPITSNIKQINKAFASLLEAKRGLFYLCGDPGIGKTVCARAFTVDAINAAMSALYIRQSELVTHLRSSYDTEHGQETYEARMKTYKDLDVLVIDELGRDRMTDFAQESLAEIVDARYTKYIQGQTRITVLVSNNPPEDIFQEYISDRVYDKNNIVLTLHGRSLRRL